MGWAGSLTIISSLFFYFFINLLGKLLETMKSGSLFNSIGLLPLPVTTSTAYLAIFLFDIFLASGLASYGKMELLCFCSRQKLVE